MIRNSPEPATSGHLTVVGTGYRIGGQVTVEALAAIRAAEHLYFLVGDPVTRDWLRQMQPQAESLHDAYSPGKSRRLSYAEMTARILSTLRAGRRVCLALYGHPGVFASLGREAARAARAEGFPALLLPGISAADCLFLDLDFDPAEGCQMYEATDFLLRSRRVDLSVALILWQIAAVGMIDFRRERVWQADGFPVLVERLVELYGEEHEVTIYEAATVPTFAPRREIVCLRDLGRAGVTPASTLFVPPAEARPTDESMRRRLHFDV